MMLRGTWISCVVLAFFGSAERADAAAGEVLTLKTIGETRELLIDDDLVGSMAGVRRVLHPARKFRGNPIVKPDQPWEWQVVDLYGSVHYDEGQRLFRMWYTVFGEVPEVAYATSHDGRAWTKPDLGLCPSGGSSHNNIVFRKESPANVFIPSVICDPADPDPARRYKMAYWDNGTDKPEDTKAGIAVAFSPDGVHWNDWPRNPIRSGRPPGDVLHVYRDAKRGQFVMHYREYPGGKRSMGLATSTNFTDWEFKGLMFAPGDTDPPGFQFYGMPAFPYESFYLGLLWVYRAAPGPETIDVRLAASRDGAQWTRVCPDQSLIPLGEPGQFDSGMIFTASAPVVHGDEILIYYAGFSNRHDAEYKDHHAAIGLATLRLDGFVSLRADSEEGVVTTKSLRLGGEALVVNVDARGGHFVAELLDESGRLMQGYSRADCKRFTGDALRHRVTWNGRSSLKPLKDRAVRLRFYLKNADLYSFHAGPDARQGRTR